MKKLNIDIETYSSYNLKDVGVYKYVSAPDFTILLLAYSIDDGVTKIIDLTHENIPSYITDALKSKSVLKYAYNGQFERIALSKYLEIALPIESFRCSMIQAMSLSLPASLKQCAKFLNLDIQKDAIGAKAIKYFSMPNKDGVRNSPSSNPKLWEDFKVYCIRDVEVERSISQKLINFPLTPTETKVYEIDQEINDTGVLIDKKFVISACEILTHLSQKALKRLKEITKLENPNSLLQLKTYLARHGIKVSSLDKKTTEKLLEDETLPSHIKEVLALRLSLSLSSTKKYQKILSCITKDNKIRGLMQMYGASKTGRWAGRLLQVQNLPKINIEDLPRAKRLIKQKNLKALKLIYDDTPNVLKQLIRTSIIAPKGYTLAVVDYAAIEARILAWYAKEKWVLDVFSTHGKIYEATAAKLFKVPIDKVDSAMRSKGKVCTLALGYQGAIGAMSSMGAYDMGLTEEEIQNLVNNWRGNNPNITRFWYDIENYARRCINEKITLNYKNLLCFSYTASSLFITLPSGRALSYPGAQIIDNKITYFSKGMSVNYEVTKTYGGKLTENIVQATARDILADALIRLKKAKIKVVFHVHDEIIAEIKKGSNMLQNITSLMSTPPIWVPGLPLRVAGYESEFYRK